MDSPKVTVLLPVYNGEKYLAEAIESILDQTFRDFEFIIINDGSTDHSPAILARYQQIDDRIRVYPQENRGLTASLNRGCQLARGVYIARMDQDDVSFRKRLEKQFDYMEDHPEIGVLGTWIECIDGNGARLVEVHDPTMPSLINWTLIFRNCVAHASVMMRRQVIEKVGLYNPEAVHAEDYDLWVRASRVTRIANLPEILLTRREWEGNICSRRLPVQEESTIKTMQSAIEWSLDSHVPLETVTSVRKVARGIPLSSLQQIEQVNGLIQRLYRAYLKTSSLTPKEAKEVAQDAGMTLVILAESAGRISLRKGLAIFVQALRLRPQLLFSRQLTTKAASKALRILLRRA